MFNVLLQFENDLDMLISNSLKMFIMSNAISYLLLLKKKIRFVQEQMGVFAWFYSFLNNFSSVVHQKFIAYHILVLFCLGQCKVHQAIQSRDMCIIIIMLGFYIDYGLILAETQRSSKVSLHTL